MGRSRGAGDGTGGNQRCFRGEARRGKEEMPVEHVAVEKWSWSCGDSPGPGKSFLAAESPTDRGTARAVLRGFPCRARSLLLIISQGSNDAAVIPAVIR